MNSLYKFRIVYLVNWMLILGIAKLVSAYWVLTVKNSSVVFYSIISVWILVVPSIFFIIRFGKFKCKNCGSQFLRPNRPALMHFFSKTCHVCNQPPT